MLLSMILMSTRFDCNDLKHDELVPKIPCAGIFRTASVHTTLIALRLVWWKRSLEFASGAPQLYFMFGTSCY